MRAAGGTVRLAKLNTDNNPELSQGLGVRSLPTVLGIFQGRMIDNFIGLQPPERIEKFMKAVAAAGGETPAGASPGDEAQAALDEAVKVRAPRRTTGHQRLRQLLANASCQPRQQVNGRTREVKSLTPLPRVLYCRLS